MEQGAAKLVWENSRASNGSLIVLLTIAFEIDDKGKCVMSIAELAAKSRLGTRTVPTALADLVRRGEIRVRPKSGDRGRNGYELCMPGYARSYAESAQEQAFDAESAQQSYAESAQDKPGESTVTAGQPASYAKSAQPQIPDALDFGSVVSGEKSKSRAVSDAPRPDVDRLCQHLADRMEANGSKRPLINQRWRTAARLMLDADGRTEKEVHGAIDWSQQHHFWHRNILSMEKLRAQYDRLALDAKAERNRPGSQYGGSGNSNLDVVARFMRRAAMEDGN